MTVLKYQLEFSFRQKSSLLQNSYQLLLPEKLLTEKIKSKYIIVKSMAINKKKNIYMLQTFVPSRDFYMS